MQTVRIPMRDGVELGADVYTPVGASKGVLLSWGPYGRSGLLAIISSARMYAAQGYTVVFASTRGTADSGGTLDPMRDEARDGQDIVAWMRRQPWYPGRFATLGGSYLGYTQWALLSDPPEDLVTAIVAVGPHDFSRHAWGTGEFNFDLLGWAEVVRTATVSLPRILINQITTGKRLQPIFRATPVVDAADAYFKTTAPWLRERLVRPDLSDHYWQPMQHADALEKVTIPILIIAGWQDIFLSQSIQQYNRLRERDVDVALTVGPWTHLQIGLGAQSVVAPESLAWLNRHLAESTSPPRSAPVRIHDAASGKWRDLQVWPPRTVPTKLYLHDSGRLAAALPPATASTRSFLFDPAKPTPAVGGNMLENGGYKNDSALAARRDVLAYDTDPLPTNLTIVGSVRVALAHSTDLPDADLFVRISDVDQKGRSRNVTETYVRLQDGPTSVGLNLLPTAYTFRAGHCVRLLVAGGSFPQFARNPGTGENPLTATSLKSNRHTIHHAEGISALELPVVDTSLG
jgi:putative CocE/NonD family hydrolase